MGDETESKIARWSSHAVNWGQLLIAFTVMGSGVVLDRLSLDRRLTVLETHQLFSTKMADNDRAEVALLKADLSRRLDDIRSQLTQISVDIARNQATSERLNDLERRSSDRERDRINGTRKLF